MTCIRPRARRLAAGLLVALLAATAVGCASRISQKNFQRVDDGMTIEQVIEILGEPTDSSSLGVGPLSGTAATWESKDAVIRIQFLNDKVRLKQFERRGEEAAGDDGG